MVIIYILGNMIKEEIIIVLKDVQYYSIFDWIRNIRKQADYKTG